MDAHTATDLDRDAQVGSPEIPEQALPALRARLMRHARLSLRDTATAEDLVQDTLLALVQQADRQRGQASLNTLAVSILKHKIADWYRAPVRRYQTALPEADGDDQGGDGLDALYDADGAYAQPVPQWHQPERSAEQRQMMRVLDNCLGCLPRQTSRVFMMREWLGFENHEISQRLGVTMDNCRTLLHRARMALRQCMQRDWLGTGSA